VGSERHALQKLSFIVSFYFLLDYSILTKSLNRKQLANRLKLVGNALLSHQTVDQEQKRLSFLLMKRHPIHEFIHKLDTHDLKRLVKLDNRQGIPYMRCLLARQYFERYPQQPLKALGNDFSNLVNNDKVGVAFKNPTGANLCYVNSSINMLLHGDKVLNCLKGTNNHIANFLLKFSEGHGIQDATCLRESVAMKFPQFGNTNQQCPAEFLLSLINSVECLKDLTRLEMMVTYECQVCKVITNSPTTEEFLMLTENIKGGNISEIYLNNRTSYLVKNCQECRATLADHKSTQTMIITPKVLLIEVKSSTTSCGTWLERSERALHPEQNSNLDYRFFL
jgi:hypothetical protein